MKLCNYCFLSIPLLAVFFGLVFFVLSGNLPIYAQGTQNSSTLIGITLLLHGIGRGGDNANPNGLGNTNPLHPQRPIIFEVYNGRSELLMLQNSTIVFDNISGSFKGIVDLGPNFPTGTYYVKVKTSKYLRKQLGDQVRITTNTTNQLSSAVLVVGDSNNDNRINILDYNVLMRCYNSVLQKRLCTSDMELSADLNDDGKVDGVDYNLFLREIWAYRGQ